MYKAIVARVKTRPFPNANNLLLGTCCNYQVIVGKDTIDGELGVFFEGGGQLSEGFATVNKLIKPVGMFEANRRVKAIKLRGEMSEGFWTPLSSFSYIGDTTDLREGDQFSEWKGVEICCRYETPATKHQQNKTRNKAAKLGAKVVGFPEHEETGHFRREFQSLPDGTVLRLSLKYHGTSHRQAHAIVKTPRLGPKWPEWLRKLAGYRCEWKHVVGTRRVNLGNTEVDKAGFYGTHQFRYDIAAPIKLHKGEVLYGEIVGYLPTGAPIMTRQSTKDLKDKEVVRRYGEVITYSYGQPLSTCRLVVYRMCFVNEDGVVFEYGWEQLKARAAQLGLEVVASINFNEIAPDFEPRTTHTFRPEGTREDVYEFIDGLVNNANCAQPLGPHPHEGVVVRAELPSGEVRWYKHKSRLFGLLEGYILDNDNALVDDEGASLVDQGV